MLRFRRAATALAFLTLGPSAATAQAPATPREAPAATPAQAPTPRAREEAPATPGAEQPYRRRSIVHHYPHPYPGMYHGDQSAGFRNPGGTGRFLEYYPAGDKFQANIERGEDPVKVAQFGGGGIPDRNEQLAAQQLGVAKYNAIQGHIDNMSRPSFGFGFFGGFN